MTTPTDFDYRLKNLLSQLTPERVVGAGGLAVLCAASALALISSPGQPLAAVAGQQLSGLGLNALAGLLQQLYQTLAAKPARDEKERLAILTLALEKEIKRDARLRVEIGAFLDTYHAFDIAQEIAGGNPALHSWLLTHIYADLSRYRADFDRIHHTPAQIKQLLQDARPRTSLPLPKW